ncbi:N-acetyltransferase [Actinospica sp. MGRD01-02]|uniref:N-acetyltransferase n=1 Tax=Actinospica acidithermotolerans TaxID=2828514 RepID=A0A941ECB8_9ACTN|nr:GNAT family N-acetyltransferase [Actinospica acidithermotolerans]MBR7827755.1 N-acetyltransferase [Actinospica acidithermotolerans]
MSKLVIEDERELEQRYAAYLDGRLVGCASAILVRETVLAPSVEVEPGKHDLGIGSLLLRRVFDDARAEGHTVLALCPYARRWADLHPGYRDVVRKPRAGELAAVGSLIAADRTMRLLHHDG